MAASPANTCSPEQQLADETEAFLEGTLVELLADQGRPILPWMVLNRPAHDHLAELRRLIYGWTAPVMITGGPAGYSDAWAMAQRSLALHMLGPTHDADEIRQLQHDVLVPLELQLITRTATEPLTLGAIVNQAVEALDHHRLDH